MTPPKPQPTMTVVDAVLGCALALDPVQELADKQNRGYFVDAINLYCGSPLGSAWCLNFCHYVGNKLLGKRWPLGKNGSCDILLTLAQTFNVVRDKPKRGAIFLKLNLKNRTDATHAGFVEGVRDDGTWQTVEGNSNSGGSREGKAVVRLTRGGSKDASVYVFVDWEALL